MKTLGIVGGIGPESTVEYYRFILEGCRKRMPETPSPETRVNVARQPAAVLGSEAEPESASFADWIAAVCAHE